MTSTIRLLPLSPLCTLAHASHTLTFIVTRQSNKMHLAAPCKPTSARVTTLVDETSLLSAPRSLLGGDGRLDVRPTCTGLCGLSNKVDRHSTVHSSFKTKERHAYFAM
jgi:hypothetical protein